MQSILINLRIINTLGVIEYSFAMVLLLSYIFITRYVKLYNSIEEMNFRYTYLMKYSKQGLLYLIGL